MISLAPDTKRCLAELVRCAGFDDPTRVLALEERDEPPLYTGYADLAFLTREPPELRGPAILDAALGVLTSVVSFLRTQSPLPRRFFLAVTLQDWQEYWAGQQVVPTLALLVDPQIAQIPGVPPRRLVQPWSPAGLQTQDWLRLLDDSHDTPFVVGELPTIVDRDLQRVYVGLRDRATLDVLSVGDALSVA